MPLDVIITTDRIRRDPIGRDLVQHLQESAEKLRIDDGVLYYDFPTYADYETVVHKPDSLLLSKRYGVVAVRIVRGGDVVEPLDESLGQFCSILIGRLLKSRILRSDRSHLTFGVVPLLLIQGGAIHAGDGAESEIATSFESLDEHLQGQELTTPLGENAFAEARSVIEGAKALTRPQKRVVDDPNALPYAAALARLELEIANFDQQQRRAAIVTIPGPQRIRGLAGSGKTVILAMKAAHLHLTQPDHNILVTFYTRSLRAMLTNLITRFYRHYRDEDPDWNRIHIRHGWGGAKTPGVYADACRRHDEVPLNLMSAKRAAGNAEPFDFACRALLQKANIAPYYHHTLIDEGQDFATGFYELCYALAIGERDDKSIIWAYDELQNILNIKIRSPEQLFGTDADHHPRVSLNRTTAQLPPGATNDTVLSKCYRNQREVLVVAHALGFGIYRETVQLLESREHWNDVGYDVIEGTFAAGERVRILRPAENSPLHLETPDNTPIINCHVATSFNNEIEWVVDGIRQFLGGGLRPEDIMVVALDDRNARAYFTAISGALAEADINTNNIIADPYTEPPFLVANRVTLSTVYRAKGNEAAVVFAVGIDAISPRTRSSRNKLFTAFTRAKAWLRVSGVDGPAAEFEEEIRTALKRFPYLDFTMPDLRQVELIQRDLSEKHAKAMKIRNEFTKRLITEGFSEDEIYEILAVEVKNGTSRGTKRDS
jgi:superfamily I DNA and RNA helicase